MPKFKQGNGFTLIELLVAISIVAVVFGIVITSAAQSKRASRDLQRKADLRTIQNGLQQYYSDQIFYPDSALPSPGNFLNSCTGNPSPCPSGAPIYISNLPSDPSTGSSYGYQPLTSSYAAGCDNTTNTCADYCLYAELENLASPYPYPSFCPSPPGYNFAITAP